MLSYVWKRPEDVPEDVRNRLRENLARHEKHRVQGPDDAGPELTVQLRDTLRSWGDFVTSIWKCRATLAEEAGEPPKCRAGCSACCSDYAMVSPPDMFLLVDAYQRLSPEDQAHVRRRNAAWVEAHADMDMFPLAYENQSQIKEFDAALAPFGVDAQKTMTGMTTSLNFRKKTPCSFLKDGKCMVYDSRPLACRGHNIIDQRGPRVCEEVLHVTEQLGVKQFVMADACEHVIQQFVEAGLPMYPNGELNHLFARWLSQEQPRQESP